MTYYIGLDAHSQTCTFVTLDKSGEVLDQKQVPTSERNLVLYLRSLKGEKHLTFEESSLAKWLYSRLKKEVDTVLVCNPSYVSRRSGAKTDYLDARHLASELRSGNLTGVFHDDKNELIKLRSFVQSYLDLARDIACTKNRFKAAFRSQAQIITGKHFWKETDLIKELEDPLAQISTQALMDQIVLKTKQKDEYLEIFKSNLKKYPVMKKLTTIPGIDIVRANVIAAIIAEGNRFENKHRFWSYACLVNHVQISDGRSYGSKKTQGSRDLKNVFIGTAECILRSKSGLRGYYDQLRLKGLDHRKAKRALARKVAAIALSIMKNNTNYEDKWQSNTKTKNIS